jgi:drug/metabolite transporter (DMT)-like permease
VGSAETRRRVSCLILAPEWPLLRTPPAAVVAPTLTPNSHPEPTRGAWAALILVQVFFASFPVAGKYAFDGFAPMAVAVWRVTVASAVFFGIALFTNRRKIWPGWRDLALLFWLSLLGVTLNQVLFIQGLALSTATNAGLVMAFIPSATYFFALLLRKEGFRLRRAIGVACAAVGIAVLVFDKGARLGGDTMKGDLMMLANASCYALYMVQARPVLARLPALVVTFWVFFFGALCVPPIAWGETWIPATASALSWKALAWVVIFPSILAYLLNTWVLHRVEASTVGIFVALQPLISIFLAVTMLGEELRPVIGITAPLVLIGVALVTRRRPRPT